MRFGLPDQIDKMAEAEILYMVVKQFAEIDLHPDVVSNLEMGYIYEELIRVTADLSNEEAGEHFTPREVIELMVNVLFADEDRLLTRRRRSSRSMTQPVARAACSPSPRTTFDRSTRSARLHLFGQEVQPESYAVCRTDMLLKGQGNAQIVFGDTFTKTAAMKRLHGFRRQAVRLHARQPAIRQGLEDDREGDQGGARGADAPLVP